MITLTEDERVRIECMRQEKAERDWINAMNYATEQGEKRGEERGERRGEARGMKMGIQKGMKQERKYTEAGCQNVAEWGHRVYCKTVGAGSI